MQRVKQNLNAKSVPAWYWNFAAFHHNHDDGDDGDYDDGDDDENDGDDDENDGDDNQGSAGYGVLLCSS